MFNKLLLCSCWFFLVSLCLGILLVQLLTYVISNSFEAMCIMLFDSMTQFHRFLLFDVFPQIRNTENPKWPVSLTQNNARDMNSAHFDGRLFTSNVDEGKLMQLCRVVEASESIHMNHAPRDNILTPNGKNNQEVKPSFREGNTSFSNVIKPSVQSLTFSTLENNRPTWEMKNMHESNAKPSLNMCLGNPSGNNSFPTSAGENIEGKMSPTFHQGPRSRPILPKLLKTGLTMNGGETEKGTTSQPRIARPPGDGRGKNQLLPRYWPRITDQELERLSGEYPLHSHIKFNVYNELLNGVTLFRVTP
jgi:hypothetical protein